MCPCASVDGKGCREEPLCGLLVEVVMNGADERQQRRGGGAMIVYGWSCVRVCVRVRLSGRR